jgi:hypothetical protein
MRDERVVDVRVPGERDRSDHRAFEMDDASSV